MQFQPVYPEDIVVPYIWNLVSLSWNSSVVRVLGYVPLSICFVNLKIPDLTERSNLLSRNRRSANNGNQQSSGPVSGRCIYLVAYQNFCYELHN